MCIRDRLDDIQFLIGKEQTQEGFFHTFNTLHLSGRQLVISSDRPPKELTLLEDRIQSRLQGGLTVDIQPPDYETRLLILKEKASKTGFVFTEEILEFLSERLYNNCLLYTSPSPRDLSTSRMPSSA